MKRRQLLSIILASVLTTAVFVGCGSDKKAEETSGKPAQEEAAEKKEEVAKGFTGTKSISVPYDETGKKKDVVIAEMTFKDGEPTDLKIDTCMGNGVYKQEASKAGEYVMKEGEDKAWHEQVDLLTNFLKENNYDTSKVTLGDKGNTDVVAGVSIKVPAYLQAVDALLKEVKDGGSNVKEGFSGWLVAETPYDPTGKKADVVITEILFKDNKPVDVKIDTKTEDGTLKSEASAAGEYVMKEGEEKAWHEQIALLQDFLKSNNFDTSKVTLIDDKGNTDAVAGVSIKVPAYLDGVNNILSKVK